MGELYEYFTGNVKFCIGPMEMELAQLCYLYNIRSFGESFVRNNNICSRPNNIFPSHILCDFPS